MDINDGGGLWDRDGMFDQLIVKCNDLVRAAMSGEYVGFCAAVVDMVQRLSALKDGVDKDIRARDERIRELEEAAADVQN